MSHSLKNMHVLAIDCQTTGGNAGHSHLVEIGWMIVRPKDPIGTQTTATVTHIVRQPQGIDPPKHILKLTGLEPVHFRNAIAPEEAWLALRAEAGAVAADNRLPLCPAVIHFARFEMSFLNKLHAAQGDKPAFPLDVWCTHQIAARLWPHLPRKGLRAVAGYLGHSVPTLKRCASHLQATAAIWRRLVDHLGEHCDVASLDQLRDWIQKNSSGRAGARTYPMPRRIRLSAPSRPGIYRFRRCNDDLLYIGKATSLKSRVNSYFQASRRHSESTLEMLTQAVKLEVTTTATALEAALLESDEIKRHTPPYNKALCSSHRSLSFLSGDFKRHGSRQDSRCPIGPVPSPEMFTALHAMGRALMSDARDMEAEEVSLLLCMPERYAPPATCLRKGLDMFLRHVGEDFNPGDPWRALIRIGHRSWREKLERRDATAEAAASDTATEKASDPPEPFEWTPDAVMRTLFSILRRCGFMLRRARWLCMISESTIAWQPSDGSPDERRVLTIQGGDISGRQRFSDREAHPAPPGGHLRLKTRQANFDLTTYDRLRVLTTELRRLVSEARPVAVRVNGRTAITPAQLSQLFRWI